MAYNRLPYQPYENVPTQPYPTGYSGELQYQEDYIQQPMPYDGYNYPMNPYAEHQFPADYRGDALRRDGWEDYSREYPPRQLPLDYDDGKPQAPIGPDTTDMSVDVRGYRDPAFERPRESWAERNVERDASPSFKRDTEDRPRRHESYRSRPRSDRAPPPKNLDPYTLDHIVPFPYFCEWYKQTNARSLSKNSEINKQELQDSFIKYRDDLLARTAKNFVKEHMSEEWFKDKYDPVLAPVTRGKIINYRKWLYEKFMQDLDSGKFDELTLDGAAARRYFAEKNGKAQSPTKKDDDEEASVTLAKMPLDPMAERKTPCIKTISTTVSRSQLEDLLGDTEGFKFMSVSDPNPNKKFARVGWVIVDDPANPDDIVSLLDDQRIHDEIYGDFTVHCTLHAPAKEQPRKALSDLHSTRESLSRDLKLAEICATKKFEAEMGDGHAGLARIKEYVQKLMATTDKDDEDEGVVKEDDIPDSLAEIKKLLDLTVEYLRRVYSFCFYCVSENDSVHELQRKCFAGHFRRPPPESITDSKTTIMQKAWSDKINLFINPEEADVIKLGGVNVEEVVHKETEAAISREAEDRWRCGVRKCTKLFLEEKFVRSHIQKRHKDWLEKIALEAQLLNNYVLDPCRLLAPLVETPPSGFGVKHHPDKEYGGSSHFEPASIMPAFTGMPQFAGFGPSMFDAPEWSMGGFDNGAMRVDSRPFRGRRGGPGGPMRRPADGTRDHPYERRTGWNERGPAASGEGFSIDKTRVKETRPLRSYRDLDAPQEATPELNY